MDFVCEYRRLVKVQKSPKAEITAKPDSGINAVDML